MYYPGRITHKKIIKKGGETLLVKQRKTTSGSIIELLDFPTPMPVGEHNVNNPYGRKGNKLVVDENGIILGIDEILEQQKQNREKTIKRNTSKFWRLYNCNKDHYPERDKFLTLTFRTLPPDINACDYELNKFIKRLKRYTKSRIEYQGIRELQLENDRSGTHYHIILYGMPFVPHSQLLTLWCKGNVYQDETKPSGVNIKGIAKGFEEMSNYLTSYVLKELVLHDFMQGHKIIIQSQGLLKPVRLDTIRTEIVPLLQDIKKGLSYIDNRITYWRLK
jgi:hypothetical protein